MLSRGLEVSRASILMLGFSGMIIDNRRKWIIYCTFFNYKD
jgi:hypothetical protein